MPMMPKGPYRKEAGISDQPLYTKDSGISSAMPLPLGSCSLKARRTSINSSVVVGTSRFSFSSQFLLMNTLDL